MNKHLKTAEGLANLLDNKFSILGIKFGIDPILDFVPWAGTAVGFVLSLYLLWIGKQMNIPDAEMRKMFVNIIVDFVIGFVPWIGFIGDIFFKANIRNLAILKKYSHRTVIEGEIVS